MHSDEVQWCGTSEKRTDCVNGRDARARRQRPGWVVVLWLSAFWCLIAPGQVHAAHPLWERLFSRSTTQYYPVGTQYVPVTGYQPVTTYVPVTTYYPIFPASTGSPIVSASGTGANYAAPTAVTAGTAGLAGTSVPLAVGQPSSYPTAAPVTSVSPVIQATGQVTEAPAGVPLAPQVAYSVGAAESAAVCPTCPPKGAQATGSPVPVTVPTVPQVSYRTIWYRVPVTSFRPVTTVDPATGATVTTVSPCVTYTWQARRVPVSAPGGFLSRLFGHHRQSTVAAPAPVPVCPPTLTSGVPIPSSPGVLPSAPGAVSPPTSYIVPPTGPAAPTGTPAPTYSPTAPSIPGTSVYPGGATIREPADMPPALEPGRSVPGASPTSPPSPSAPPTGTGGSGGQPSGSATSVSSGAMSSPTNRSGQADRVGSVVGTAEEAVDSPSTPISRDPDTEFRLRPIPAPGAAPNAPRPTPRLVNPRDRTAQRSGPPHEERRAAEVKQAHHLASAVVDDAGDWGKLAYRRGTDSELSGVKRPGSGNGGAGESSGSSASSQRPVDDGGWRSRSPR